MVSPGHTSNQTKQNKCAIDQTWVGETRYIAWPSHPQFGSAVRVFRQFQADNQTWCLLEDLSHPGFQIQIKAQWLSSTRPSEPQPQAKQSPIILPLSALDKLVQMILSKNQLWRVDKDDEAIAQSESTPVASTATRKQITNKPLSLLHGTQPDRRDK